VVLKSIRKAGPFLRNYTYDAESADLMMRFLNDSKNGCEDPFNEEYFFRIESIREKEQIMRDIKTKFHNISKILDCVSCEKCRLNGKVQIKGLGTAMKVLFSQPKSLIPNQRDEMKLLTRTEIVVIFI
jgi:hypothetical protein